MTRVKLPSLDPMPALRAAKKEAVNKAFSALAAQFLHLDQVYAQKRAWAANAPALLKPEADLRGIAPAALAALILSKPDTLAAREMQRQQIMARIDAAKEPSELVSLTVNNK